MVYNIQAFEPGFWNSILDRKKGPVSLMSQIEIYNPVF